MEATIDKEWWEAVLSRDARFDGVLVFGVLSTGIYCRPSCPARRPRADRVVFFLSPEDAEKAGFRACLRCRPDEAVARDPQVEMVKSLCRFIEGYDRPDRPLTLAVMSDHVKVSPHHLQRTFSRIMRISPRRYAEMCRLNRLKGLVKKGQSITTALYGAGYGSSSRLYEGASARMGMTPGAYRKGGKGMHIRYAIVDCPLGRLLVAATEKGVSAVSVGDSDEPLVRALFAEYPSAEIESDGAGLGGYIGSIVGYLEGGEVLPDLPTDVVVTAFQARVYEALRAIPYGSVRTYGEVAEAIGRPAAARAVGNACAANPTALVIPCHRVVRTDGDPGGYRWGVERKKALLAREREMRRDESFEKGAGI